MTDFFRRTGILPGTAMMVSSDAPAATIRQARILKARYGDLIQICDGVADHLNFNTALAALPATGGLIQWSAGTFHGKRCRVPDRENIVNRGCGFNTKYILEVLTQPEADASMGIIFSYENASYGGVFDMLLDNNGRNQVAKVAPGIWWYIGIETDANTYYFSWDNIYCYDCIGGGIYISNSKHCQGGRAYGYLNGVNGPQQRSLLDVEGGEDIHIESLIDRESRGGALSITASDVQIGRVSSYNATVQAVNIDGCSDVHIGSLLMYRPASGLVFSGNNNRITIDTIKVPSMIAAAYPISFTNGTMYDIVLGKVLIPSSVRGIFIQGGGTEAIMNRFKIHEALVSASGGESYRFDGRLIDSELAFLTSIQSAGEGIKLDSPNNDGVSLIAPNVRDAGDHYSGIIVAGNSIRISCPRSRNTAAGYLQDWGIKLGNVTNSTMKGADLSGNLVAPIAFDAAFSPDTNHMWDVEVMSVKLDLSGGSVDSEVYHAVRAGVLMGYKIAYSEVTSADAGVNVRIGRYQNGVALDDDYYDITVSEVSKNKGYTKTIKPSDCTNTVIAAGDTVTVGTAGGKIGTGEVFLELYIANVGV